MVRLSQRSKAAESAGHACDYCNDINGGPCVLLIYNPSVIMAHNIQNILIIGVRFKDEKVY